METAEPIDIQSYREIGDLLRAAREELRLSLDQSARLLHIRLRYIDALEQGRLNELPGITYTKGYLQAYASFLGLDKDEVLRRFENIEEHLTRKHIYFPQAFSKEKKPSPMIVWGGLVAAVLAYGLWSLLAKSHLGPISMVEAMVAKHDEMKLASVQNKKCFHAQDEFFPPCTTMTTVSTDFLPLHRNLSSIMEFNVVKLVEDAEAEPAEEEQ